MHRRQAAAIVCHGVSRWNNHFGDNVPHAVAHSKDKR
jgi:hypothetical protein